MDNRIFTRKQLAWLGLIIGIAILVALNFIEDYWTKESVIESLADVLFGNYHKESLEYLINAVLLLVVWFARVKIGSALIFIVGGFIKKV